MPDGTVTLTDVSAAPRGAKLSPRPHLFVALECDRPLAESSRHALEGIDEVVIGRGSARTAARDQGKLLLKVPDRWMSSTHARVLRVAEGWAFEDAGSKNGSLVNGETCVRTVLSDGDLIECGHTLFLFRAALPSGADDPDDLDSAQRGGPAAGLTTLVPALARELAALAQVAHSTVPVLFSGESGAGKEVAARALHALSGRTGSFVAINCGALPPSLVESELFGSKRGAFSGAVADRPGLVRSADGGTLFLDEIGDLPLKAQAAFLRVLQEREVLPVGGTKPVKVDIRLVSATHQDLTEKVLREEFREDLLARLSGFSLKLPALRERREDIGALVADLLRKETPERSDEVAFGRAVARSLYRYEWPHNIRELGRALQSAVVLASGGVVEIEHLPPAVRTPAGNVDAVVTESVCDEPSLGEPLDPEDAARREELLALLAGRHGNVSQVARELGCARMQILRWVKRYGIDLKKMRQGGRVLKPSSRH